MTHDPEGFAAIAAAAAPAFSRDGRTLFHLRGSGLPQVWALDLGSGDGRQLTFHDEKVALLRRSPVDDRLIHGIDRGGDERQQLLLIDPNDASPEPRKLSVNPAAIHDFGGWSPDGTRIAYASNERDEAHFDVYVQEVATGTRRCVFDGSNEISVSGFRSDGMKLALLHDRGFGDMSLLLLDVTSGDAHPLGSPANFARVRWGERRTHAAGTDRSRWPRLPATVPAGPGHRRGLGRV
jgi:Tol biopolymer transport system component